MKITDHGYWVSKLFYYQSIVYYFLYSIYFRSFTFFAASNPAIRLGGMLDEKKSEIYNSLPAHLIPKTILYDISKPVKNFIEQSNLDFPLILKPDIGFKGFNVIMVNDLDELEAALPSFGETEVIMQDFIDYEGEFSLLYYKMPRSLETGITSIIEKKYPFVTGDGHSSLRQLIEHYKNDFINKADLLRWHAENLEGVVETGKQVILHRIGNYSRGSKFESLQSAISPELIAAADKHFAALHGFDFFRIDFKSRDLDGFIAGDFKIIELNGAKAEPLHIYDSKHGWMSVIRDIHRHWMTFKRVIVERRTFIFDFPSTATGVESLKMVKKLVK